MAKIKPPKRARFFLADDIRLESSQKPMMIGFFPNDLMHIILPENINPTPESPVGIAGISILVAFFDFHGSLEMKMSLTSPSGEILINEESLGSLENGEGGKDATNNIVIRLAPFIIKVLGKYKLVINILKEVYEYEFDIQKKTEY